MSSRPSTPASSQSRSLTALACAIAAWRASRAGSPPESPRPWELRKNRRGQNSGEIHAFAGIVGTFTLAAVFDLASRLMPAALSDWHWPWITLLVLGAWFILLHVVGLACAFAGAAFASLGFLSGRRPPERTSFWFLLLLTLYAAHAISSPRWIAAFAGVWLALVCLNAAASVWCAMKSAES